MAKFTEEQKNAVLARIPKIGLSEAAKEAGVPVSTVSFLIHASDIVETS